MTILPIVDRELRVQSRSWMTYGLRVLGATLLLTVAAVLLDDDIVGGQGARLFHDMHLVLFWGVWILVPLVVADCISRERREGTIGLLFLTRLSPLDIVLAKGLAGGLRVLTAGVACLPVLVLPFILGGMEWREVMVSVAMIVGSFLWALAAGLTASVLCRSMNQALVWSYILAVPMFLFLMFIIGWALLAGPLVNAVSSRYEGWQWWGSKILAGWWMATDFNDMSRYFNRFNPARLNGQLVGMSGMILLSSLVGFMVILLGTARTLRRVWMDPPPSRVRARLTRIFCTPSVAVGWFRKWMKRKIQRNPVGWLEQRTWQARLITWSWLAILISLYSAVLSDMYFMRDVFYYGHRTLAVFLLGSVALTAAGSFRRERETGVLELLMVSPQPVVQIIWGRLRGIWGQFLPTILLFAGVWFYLGSIQVGYYHSNLRGEAYWIFLVLSGFAAIPFIGLYFSLKFRHFMMALGMTLAVGLALPMSVVMLFPIRGFTAPGRPNWMYYSWFEMAVSIGILAFPIVIQLIAARMLARRLTCSMERRTIGLERTLT